MRLTTAGAMGMGLLVVLVAACTESSADKDTNKGGNGASSSSSSGAGGDSGKAAAEDLAPDSSPLIERSSLCETAQAKSCNHGFESIDECESALLGTTVAFIDALTKCVDAAATCDWPTCRETAKKEVAPGYPDVPLIKDCQEHNEECEYTLDPATPTEKRKEAINTRCQEVVILDEKRLADSEACKTKSCDDFAQCIVEVTDR